MTADLAAFAAAARSQALAVYSVVAQLRAAGRVVTTVPGCVHLPPCPAADQPNHDAAVEVACHHEQGWIRLCNGVILFDDLAELVPDNSPRGCHIEDHRGPAAQPEGVLTMTADTTHPKFTIPRSAGQWREIKNLKPGWWVHLEASPDAPAGTPSGWEQISTLIVYTSGRRAIVFRGTVEGDDGNAITVHKWEQAVTLTEREATKRGLIAEVSA